MRCAHPRLQISVTLILLLVCAVPALAFDIIAPPAGRRTMNLNLGTAPFQTLGYGVKSWNQLAEDALNVWNDSGVGQSPDHEFFTVSTGGGANPCQRDGINEVRFATTLCGAAWGNIVGVSLMRSDGTGKIVETDIIFNSTMGLDAYPGPRRGPIDFFRVAVHEFGHSIGLDHPDEAGQSVTAVMNAFVSNVDTIQPDDAAGARAIPHTAPPSAGVESFVRGFYRQILGRTPRQPEVAGWVAWLAGHPDSLGASRAMAHGFLESAEHLSRPTTLSAYVGRLYGAILGRASSAAETADWVAIVAGRFNQVLPGFINSPEFEALRTTTPPGTIVTRLYEQTLGRTPSPAEVAGWVNVVAVTGDWQLVAQGFLNSPEYLARPQTVADHVTVLYRTFLGRQPAPAEVAGWVPVFVNHLVTIEDAFLDSPEFGARARAVLGR